MFRANRYWDIQVSLRSAVGVFENFYWMSLFYCPFCVCVYSLRFQKLKLDGFTKFLGRIWVILSCMHEIMDKNYYFFYMCGIYACALAVNLHLHELISELDQTLCMHLYIRDGIRVDFSDFMFLKIGFPRTKISLFMNAH